MSSEHPDIQQLTVLVRRAFPDVVNVSVEPVPGGHENAIYHLALDNGLPVTLKLYTAADPAARAAREARILRMLTSETGVPVPRVLHHGEAAPGIARDTPWALLTRLPGTPLTDVMDSLDNWELEAVGYEAGRYLARVHAIGADRFGALFASGAHDHVREKAFFCAQTSDWLDRCVQNGLLPHDSTTALRHAFAETGYLNRQQPCLVHGQFRARNVLVERGVSSYHVTGFVDFSRARGAAPELDASTVFALDFAGRHELQKGFLDGYGETGDLGPTFWERLTLYGAFSSLEGLWLAHQQGLDDDARAFRRQLDHFLAGTLRLGVP